MCVSLKTISRINSCDNILIDIKESYIQCLKLNIWKPSNVMILNGKKGFAFQVGLYIHLDFITYIHIYIILIDILNNILLYNALFVCILYIISFKSY